MLLVRAVSLGDPRVIGALMTAGAKADIAGDDGYNALQLAVWNGEPRLIALLLQRGADPNAASSTQPPPIVLAAERGRLDVVTLLVERGADVQVRYEGWTALRAAELRGHAAIVAYLRAHGAR